MKQSFDLTRIIIEFSLTDWVWNHRQDWSALKLHIFVTDLKWRKQTWLVLKKLIANPSNFRDIYFNMSILR